MRKHSASRQSMVVSFFVAVLLSASSAVGSLFTDDCDEVTHRFRADVVAIGGDSPYSRIVPNPAASHSAARNVADRDRVALMPLTAMVATGRLLVVLRRSGV